MSHHSVLQKKLEAHSLCRKACHNVEDVLVAVNDLVVSTDYSTAMEGFRPQQVTVESYVKEGVVPAARVAIVNNIKRLALNLADLRAVGSMVVPGASVGESADSTKVGNFC